MILWIYRWWPKVGRVRRRIKQKLKLKIRIILNTNRTHTRKNQQKKARCMRAHALTVRHVLLSKLEGKENVDTCRCHGRKREQIGAWSRIGPIGGEGYTTILPTAPSRRSGGCRVYESKLRPRRQRRLRHAWPFPRLLASPWGENAVVD
jgi:hypothetical protein